MRGFLDDGVYRQRRVIEVSLGEDEFGAAGPRTWQFFPHGSAARFTALV
jgi:hypothetical protein